MTRHNGGAWELRYICRDQLGSITHVTDSVGNLLQELSYDAWGNLRAPSTHELYTQENQPTPLLGRGYTGYEHLPFFGLINMNARMYDPVTARFLSPDPYVQSYVGMQGYNRYSYCLNNPLKYTDETGEFPWLAVAIIGGGIANVVAEWENCNGFWEYTASFAIGASATALTLYMPTLQLGALATVGINAGIAAG